MLGHKDFRSYKWIPTASERPLALKCVKHISQRNEFCVTNNRLTVLVSKITIHREFQIMKIGARPDLRANILHWPVSTKQDLFDLDMNQFLTTQRESASKWADCRWIITFQPFRHKIQLYFVQWNIDGGWISHVGSPDLWCHLEDCRDVRKLWLCLLCLHYLLTLL